MGTPGPTAGIPLKDVLDVFAARDDPAEPLTATEVADALGCSRRTAHNKLTKLTDQGELKSKKVGARGRVWWVADETDTEVDFTQGFGAFKGTDFADQVADARVEMNQDFEQRQEEHFGKSN
ncbi:helix-turn-helix domain-containing protein [Haladaptatus sp. GCM10025707]|uniref:helix-turn-helix domain-containing protein n=1 Tax=Haladaptatus sp. GCM10025707 TaxID=3252658 RepID=UPI003622ED76